MAKIKKREEERDTTGWMITFTNLVILLLAFFIVLVAMGSADQKKKRAAINSLYGSFGFKSGGQDALGTPSGKDITVGQAPMVKEDVDIENLRNIPVENGLESDVKIEKEGGKKVITINNRVLFPYRSNRISGNGIRFLTSLARILKEGSGFIQLRGYSNSEETVLSSDPGRESIIIAVKRALAVLHFLIDVGKIPENRIVAHGFPSVSMNKEGTAGKRGSQGQVEIIVDDRERIPYHLKIRQDRKGGLDFKGFLFETPGSGNGKL